MSVDREKALRLESEFLSGMERNLEAAKGTLLRGSIWNLQRGDASDALRNLMARHRRFDRRLLADLPRNRHVALHSYKRRWWLLGRKRVGVALAAVLSPLEWYVEHAGSDNAAPPVGASQLLDHIRACQVDATVPHVIGICSPTGFTPEALEVQSEHGNVTLVLIEPVDGGGWRVVGGTPGLDDRILELFDPEDLSEKRQRVAQHLSDHSALLLTGSISADQVADSMGLDLAVVEDAFSDVAREDPELHVTRQSDRLLLFRGAAAPTKERSMSVVDRIRQLFSGDGDDRHKINELTQSRAALAQRRDRLYDDIVQLEKREADLVEQGRQNKSPVVRRRIAAQVAQLRKDVQRQHSTANMLNKQIEILSTHVHNLTLLQQKKMADLPDTETLTADAVRAEEMLETLQADAELAGSLETGLGDMLASDEELSILAEFDAPQAEEPQPETARGEASPAPESLPPVAPEDRRREAEPS